MHPRIMYEGNKRVQRGINHAYDHSNSPSGRNKNLYINLAFPLKTKSGRITFSPVVDYNIWHDYAH